MDLKVVCQKKEANEKNALGPFIHCRGKTPGTKRLEKDNSLKTTPVLLLAQKAAVHFIICIRRLLLPGRPILYNNNNGRNGRQTDRQKAFI